jgi:transcriptional regulator with XRE-family HTH domain
MTLPQRLTPLVLFSGKRVTFAMVCGRIYTTGRMHMEETFGGFLKRKRLERRISLRAFCSATQIDPANYSKLERGVLPPPREQEKLEVYERALCVAPGSPESRELRRLAALQRGEIPPAVLSDKDLMGKLPALFRTLEGDPVDEHLLDDLIDTIRRE